MKELSDCRVLIVDDVKANVDVLVQALRGEYKLSASRSAGRRRCEAVRRSPPDLVLLDIVDARPRRLRGVPAPARGGGDARDCPSCSSARSRTWPTRRTASRSAGNDYLTKPFEMLEVKARVRSLLKAKAYADAVKAAAERDLRIAREIQMGILPADIAAEAARHAARRARRSSNRRRRWAAISSRCCGSPTSRLLVAVGDVSGKGIPAALFMAVAMTLLRSMARDGHPPRSSCAG